MGIEKLYLQVEGVVYAGGPVSGKVVVKISGSETTTGILLRCFGTVDTRWTDHFHHYDHHHHSSTGSFNSIHHHGGHHNHTSTRIIPYSGHEILLNVSSFAVGDGKSEMSLPTGETTFLFSFKLPKNPLPPNCDFGEVKVHYGLEARILKPKSVDFTVEVPIKIVTLIDLNTVPGADTHLQVADSRMSRCCCCCERSPLTVFVSIEHMGNCVGETLPILVQISNQSNMLVRTVEATLTQIWNYYGMTESLLFDNEEMKQRVVPLTGVQKLVQIKTGKKEAMELHLEIPKDTFASIPNNACRILKLSYTITVDIIADGSFDAMTFVLPIVLGNVPLKTNQITEQSPLYEG